VFNNSIGLGNGKIAVTKDARIGSGTPDVAKRLECAGIPPLLAGQEGWRPVTLSVSLFSYPKIPYAAPEMRNRRMTEGKF